MKRLMQHFVVGVSMLLFSHSLAADKVVVIPLFSASKVNNTVTVSAKGGDFVDPVAAVNSISDASAANPYLVLIGPGVYTLTRTLKMKAYVSVAGSGRYATILTGAISSDTEDATSAIISGASFTSLSDLTIRNNGGGAVSIALYNENSSALIHRVATYGFGGTNSYGIYNTGSSPHMTDVTASASLGTTNYGVYNFHLSHAVMNNVNADASGGTTSYGIFNSDGSSPDMTDVSTSAVNGTLHNYGMYNSGSSPTMTDVTATAYGGLYNYGVYNSSSTPSMTDVIATTMSFVGGFQKYGVYNSGSSPIMTNVTAHAFGAGSYNIGVYNSANSNPQMTNVTAIASGGSTSDYGVYNTSSSPIITQSTLDGATNGLYNAVGTTIVIRSSIKGGVNLYSGVLSCVNSDNGIATELSSNCTMPP